MPELLIGLFIGLSISISVALAKRTIILNGATETELITVLKKKRLSKRLEEEINREVAEIK